LHQMSCKGKWIPKFLIIFLQAVVGATDPSPLSAGAVRR
jgi:hypothetical protein